MRLLRAAIKNPPLSFFKGGEDEEGGSRLVEVLFYFLCIKPGFRVAKKKACFLNLIDFSPERDFISVQFLMERGHGKTEDFSGLIHVVGSYL
jgi:hypothetical protein